MDDDALNMQIRKFLKNVGITSQREIEAAIREGLANGTLTGSETLTPKVTLTIGELNVSTDITGSITLE